MRVTNLKDVKEGGNYELIPKGRYDLMIVGADEKIAKTSGNPYISLKVKVMNEDQKGNVAWTNLNGNEVGLSILKSILVYNNSPLAELEGDVDFDPASLVGMKISANIDQEKGQDGNFRNNVKGFKAVSEEFANVDESFFDKKPSVGGGNGAEALANSYTPPSTDDLPF